MTAEMRLSILGSGAAFSEVGHNSAHVLDGKLLLDCGAPVTSLLPGMGGSVGDLEAILISHFHGDHVIHLPTLLVARRLQHPGAPPLRLIGPPGFLHHLKVLGETAFGTGLWSRIEAEDGPLWARVEEWEEGRSGEVAGYQVEAYSVIHAPELECLGYRIAIPGLSLGYTGDTTYCPGLLRLARSVDHLLCECSSFSGPQPTHLWGEEVATLMRELPSLRLILTHLNERRPLPGALLASDGLTVTLRGCAGG